LRVGDGRLTLRGVEGRVYVVRIKVTYAGGRLPKEERAALRAALQRCAPELAMSVADDLYSVVVLAGELRADTSLLAMQKANATVDDALYAAGLLDKFDIAGKGLHVALRTRAYASSDHSGRSGSDG
jgi:hypothetical protein